MRVARRHLGCIFVADPVRRFSPPHRVEIAGRRLERLRTVPRRLPPLAVWLCVPTRPWHRRPRFYPRRWMMLPEGRGLHPGHGKLGGYIRFFNLSTGAFVRAKLPLFRNHCIVDSVDGLLLLQRDQDTVIRLLHPFTGDIADLPPLATLPRLPGVHYHMKDTCSYFRSNSFSVSADGVITVVIALSRRHLAFATSRDQQWHLGGWRLSPVWRQYHSEASYTCCIIRDILVILVKYRFSRSTHPSLMGSA
ncbi:hypothetical protein BRADI_1g62247v3 [Brachypodium distachyon]|uniref:KIB1-4 beta-propeller domain-containing protein n=1 Tax=Brachypodium distachyon TaxID=15368 RepID=A0A2K2DT04_BRADI|nr:hypothetical protein BRADI_1g62247v3 [Brachypodium distachyon]